jgi:Protein of unknown function (DUF2568)
MAASGVGTTLVLGARFLTELALVAGAAWAASTTPRNPVVAILTGIAAALAVAAVWSVAIAPASRRRVKDPVRLAIEIALFLLVALGLDVVGQVVAAVVLAVAGVAAAVGVRFVHAPPAPPRRTSDDAGAPPTGDSPTQGRTGQLRRPRGRGRGRRD